ncbi:hypothetical protein CHGG_04521 [Chaetomium globosum CBS 148.51]|uniref:Ig-like domain-containing protein n=1 Tax=Chaetomium globosum (strain ATCC 6205 / CBS 148.51 / DSM 1962 / NBRC 6347 / NRRL 1970) TaxID=306901 RepID=Q2H125_CHAGB|nr:uncharacterized protein CHGG_04521 [Chaetomium globosum CBS 148.51]EAQ87902.1 hypothetical protein CHGG_04521 [Chaetomium globosum CBS 148.51]
MVGGRRVLLSIAVISGLGFDSVLGGQFRRRDGTVDSVQGAAGVPGSGSSSPTDVESSTWPSTTVTIVGTGSEGSTGSSAKEEETTPGLRPQAISSGKAEASVKADQRVATSTGGNYVDPGAIGAGGSLTTDTRAPVRSAEPTRSSIEPGAETNRGPPPEETRPPLTKLPPTRGPRPQSTSSADYNYAPVTTAAPAVDTAESRPTAPRGGPPGEPPSRASSFTITHRTTETIDLGYGPQASGATTFVTSARPGNQTFTYIPSGSVSYCRPSEMTGPPTTWSVVYTSTITWYGNPEDYSQPYPPISVPQSTSSCVVPISPPKLTISVCASTGVGTQYLTCEVTTTTESYGFGVQTSVTPQVVFLTTDKNPAVVFSTIDKPDYGVSQDAKTRDHHANPTQAPNDDNSSAGYNSPGDPQAISDSAHRPTPTPITVAVQPTGVVINGNTIRDNPMQPTQVVIIAGQTFTIDPTRVVGGGATIDRPSATGGIYLPEPTSTNIEDVPVIVSSTIAIIGGSSFTLGPTATTATVSGKTFTVGPSTIAGGSQTLPLPTLPSPTEVVVAGGDLITAIGSSVLVIHGTTLTYALTDGPDGADATTTVTVDDDVLTLGRGGITAQGGAVTLGGAHASSPQDTQYALVGGATITKVGASVVVINGVSYTVGPGTGTTTTAVGGENVTIMPSGVEVGTLSLRFPFGPTTVITPGAGPGGSQATPTGPVDGGGDGEEDGVGALRPWMLGVGWGVGVALGVGVLV